MPKKAEQVHRWGKKEISKWLEQRNLVKFVPLFMKNGIVGPDLAESRLTFLYNEDVAVGDREHLLAEIYLLLHPHRLTPASPPSSSLGTVSQHDQFTFQAAVQVANSLTDPPIPVVLLEPRRNRHSPVSLTSTKTLTLPDPKPRSRSESRAEASEQDSSPSSGRKYLKRKSTPAVHDDLHRGVIHSSSLFDTLYDDGHVLLHCVRVSRSEAAAKFNFSYQTMADSCLLVTGVTSPAVQLHPGDRLLEVNGILLPGYDRSSIDSILCKSACLDLVVIRPRFSALDVKEATKMATDSQHLQEKVVMQEVRWQSMRHLLTQLQHKNFDPLTLTGRLRKVEDLEDIKKRAQLETELEDVESRNTELQNKINGLQAALRDKDDELERVKKERDRTLELLRSRLVQSVTCLPSTAPSPLRHHQRGDSQDSESGTPDSSTSECSEDPDGLFSQQILADLTRLERSDATKEDVLHVLWEHTRATQRHVQFMDRVISMVSQRAPWMLADLERLEHDAELLDTVVDPPDGGASPGPGRGQSSSSPVGTAALPRQLQAQSVPTGQLHGDQQQPPAAADRQKNAPCSVTGQVATVQPLWNHDTDAGNKATSSLTDNKATSSLTDNKATSSLTGNKATSSLTDNKATSSLTGNLLLQPSILRSSGLAEASRQPTTAGDTRSRDSLTGNGASSGSPGLSAAWRADPQRPVPSSAAALHPPAPGALHPPAPGALHPPAPSVYPAVGRARDVSSPRKERPSSAASSLLQPPVPTPCPSPLSQPPVPSASAADAPRSPSSPRSPSWQGSTRRFAFPPDADSPGDLDLAIIV